MAGSEAAAGAGRVRRGAEIPTRDDWRIEDPDEGSAYRDFGGKSFPDALLAD